MPCRRNSRSAANKGVQPCANLAPMDTPGASRHSSPGNDLDQSLVPEFGNSANESDRCQAVEGSGCLCAASLVSVQFAEPAAKGTAAFLEAAVEADRHYDNDSGRHLLPKEIQPQVDQRVYDH